MTKSLWFSVAAIILLAACQAGLSISSPGSAMPTAVPSAVPRPTAESSPGPQPNDQPVFELRPNALCPGQQLEIVLVRSALNRGSLPILLDRLPGSPAADAANMPVPTPMPLAPRDPVELGQLEVAPLGTGSLQLTIGADYTARSGQTIHLQIGDQVTLYAELAPGRYAWINGMSVCPPPAPTPLPGQPPTPMPFAAPSTAP